MSAPVVAVIEHAAAEGPARIGAALAGRGVEVRHVRADLGEPMPALGDLAGLVVMGGLQDAFSDEGFPSRSAELGLLAAAVEAGTPVLGVCLGAQLLAEASGGKAKPGQGPEIGWGPVTLAEAAEHDPLLAGVARQLTVLHWHLDTYQPPPGAVRLASSPVYPEQAFRVGERAWGLQFHVEVDQETVEAFLASTPEDARHMDGGGEALLARAPEVLALLAPVQDTVFGRFADLVAS
jgi:GMP synthase-like glutamine amidotransferase